VRIFTARNTFRDDDNIKITKQNALHTRPDPHVHEFIELVYIYSGEGRQIINGKPYDVRAGDLLFINFGQTHEVCTSDMEFVNILLKPEFMSEKLVNSENIFEIFALSGLSVSETDYLPELASFRGEEFAAVHGIVEAMLAEYAERRDGWRTVLYGYMQVLFTMMIRKLKAQSNAPAVRFITDITDYIDAHFREKLTLHGIAAACFYNPSYFSRRFKEYYGKNLTAYIREKRLNEACRLLRESSMTAEEIAGAVGFGDKAQFYRSFRTQYACTPDEFRKSKKTRP